MTLPPPLRKCLSFALPTIALGGLLTVPVGGCSQPAPAPPVSVIAVTAQSDMLSLGDSEYFRRQGLDVMAFSDFYPEGHQGGVSIIQNGTRTAANGDLRLEPTPGQWQPVPKLDRRTVDRDAQQITTVLSFPDASKNRKGFNPIEYPDLELSYSVHVRPDGKNFRIIVDLQQALPEQWVGRIGFNLELFPGEYFGKSYLMDEAPGRFPRQLGGPLSRDKQGRIVGAPLAEGRRLTVAPGAADVRIGIEAISGGPLQLLDGRAEHNNGWFVVRSLVSAGVTQSAIEWKVSPSALDNWLGTPTIQVSQVGYHPQQSKIAVIELDRNDSRRPDVQLQRLGSEGQQETVIEIVAKPWGKFLRYNYLQVDFSKAKKPGIYRLQYGEQTSHSFEISPRVFDRGVWQPTLEYFLPVQMCHVRVNDRYRVWHDRCHQDDARMAPVNLNHFDGYVQGDKTLSQFAAGQRVNGLNRGGWHDAGDYDLRVESQMRTVRILSQIHEAFGLDYDATSIDQKTKTVEMHRPDGRPDVLQQIEHGVLSVLGGYENLGRLYRGIIAPTNRQYVLLGDAAAQTDQLPYDRRLSRDNRKAGSSGVPDDRWVFTEENPKRQLEAAAGLAAASAALKTYNARLSRRCLSVAKALFDADPEELDQGAVTQRVEALVELALATGDNRYRKELLQRRSEVFNSVESTGWVLGRLLPQLKDKPFVDELAQRMQSYRKKLDEQAAATPFGVPYEPKIWGAGWGVQSFGVPQYFLHRGWPDIFGSEYLLNALNFVLGTHPGSNTASFVSGVGAQSLTVAYGVNRADWSYIPGGVGSGTALIRPDFPELKTWPFFWQQSEYVMGGGGTHFLFLVLAAQQILGEGQL